MLDLFRSRQSTMSREAQQEAIKAKLASEGYANFEEKLSKSFFERMKLSRAQRRAGIKLHREGVMLKRSMTWEQFVKQFLPPAGVLGADGLFYNDLREPHNAGDIANPITLATTDKAMYRAMDVPVLGAGYMARPGKRLRVAFFGKFTTAATPGNLTIDIYWGTGADANGVILASSAAVALLANQTNLSFWGWFEIACVTIGTAGTLFCTGIFFANVALIASTTAPMLIPASAAVVSGAVDTTAALIPSLQFKRSGSTAEAATIQQLTVTALN